MRGLQVAASRCPTVPVWLRKARLQTQQTELTPPLLYQTELTPPLLNQLEPANFRCHRKRETPMSSQLRASLFVHSFSRWNCVKMWSPFGAGLPGCWAAAVSTQVISRQTEISSYLALGHSGVQFGARTLPVGEGV